MPAVVNKTKRTPFAMVRADWAIIGGPQASKISCLPISLSAKLSDSVIIFTRSDAELSKFNERGTVTG